MLEEWAIGIVLHTEMWQKSHFFGDEFPLLGTSRGISPVTLTHVL